MVTNTVNTAQRMLTVYWLHILDHVLLLKYALFFTNYEQKH